jgi:hypothetical protein
MSSNLEEHHLLQAEKKGVVQEITEAKSTVDTVNNI